jgi:hypothetical protein
MKELSIEEKAKRYDEALGRMKSWARGEHPECFTEAQKAAEFIFPELKENEDEKTKRILHSISNKMSFHLRDIFTEEEFQCFDAWSNAWLEKQAPVEHLELKAGHWYMCHRAYCCRADSLTIREGERLMCEKDGVVKGFVIKDPEKYFIEVQAPAPMEDDQNDEVRRRSTIQVLEYARSLDAYNQYGKADIDKNIAWLEKQE